MSLPSERSCLVIPFSTGSSRPRDWTWVSLIACGFFAIWATREAPILATLLFSSWALFTMNYHIFKHWLAHLYQLREGWESLCFCPFLCPEQWMNEYPNVSGKWWNFSNRDESKSHDMSPKLAPVIPMWFPHKLIVNFHPCVQGRLSSPSLPHGFVPQLSQS